MEASILDEDLSGLRSSDDHARQINSGNIALQCLGIAHRTHVITILRKLHTDGAQEIEIRVIASKRKDKVILQALFAVGSADAHEIFADLAYRAVEERFHLASLDAVLDIRLDPILHVGMNA